jgi:hypothetical protein
MRKTSILLAALCALVPAAPTLAGDQRPRGGGPDRLEAFRGVSQGDILPLNVIRDRISARLPGAHLIGADLVGGSIYRLRFMRGANVILVDVDARTGNPLRCSGC